MPRRYPVGFERAGEMEGGRGLHGEGEGGGRYTGGGLWRRARLIAGNGRRQTYFAGAFLGDGLHEGAVRSAVAVSERLGGRHAEIIARGDHRP